MASRVYEIWQDGICVASVTGANDVECRREIMRYAFQYMQDGAIEIRGPNAKAVFDQLAGRTLRTNDDRTDGKPNGSPSS
jgi:hypothetical protein